MEAWKRNLYILWFGSFFVSIGIGMIVPFLPLYVQELGIHDVKEAALWAAVIFGINHVMIALVSPFWGKFSDKYGQKKSMLRSGFGMAFVIAAMGLVGTPVHLLLLRALFGVMNGFQTSAVALMAMETPKEQVGKALGTLQTGLVSGQLFGPLLGGVLAEWLGMRNSFFFTGFFILVASILVLFGVQETKQYPPFKLSSLFQKGSASAPGTQGKAAAAPKLQFGDVMKQSPVIVTLFVSTFLIALSFQSISPIITLYVKSMHIENHVEIMAGLIFASSALGTMIASPFLGRIGDKYGHLRVLLISLVLIAALYIPQASVDNAWVLMGLRFLSGLCVGGLVPSISSLLRGMTPLSLQGSVFAYNTSANSAGNVIGALFGGVMASNFGIPIVFHIISGVFVLHFVMLIVQARKMNRTIKEAEL